MSRTTLRSTVRGLTLAALPFLMIACDSPTATPEPNPAPAEAAAIELSVPAEALIVGDRALLEATVLGADGSVLERPVAWSSSDTTLAAVSPDGLLEARAAGVVQVSATADGLTARVSVWIRNAAPVLKSMVPASAVRGTWELEITVTGSGFAADATVLWNGTRRPTTVVSGTEARVQLAAEDLAVTGFAYVMVSNPGEIAGYLSGPLTFTIEEPTVTWATYRLQGLEGERTLPVEVGRFTWYDADGGGHAAIRQVVDGTVRIRGVGGSAAQWEQTVTMVTVLEATGEEVARSGAYSYGGVGYDLFDGSFVFTSWMVADPQTHYQTTMLEGEGFVLRQALDAGAENTLGWVYVQE